MNPIERLDYYKDSYTKNEVLIYKWIKDNPNSVIKDSIELLAKEIHTSKAAIIRFSKKIGYNGFAELKFELSRYIVSGERKNNTDEELDTIKSITSLYTGFIKQINDFVQLKDIQNIAQIIFLAKKVKIIGRNRTGFSAQQFRFRLSKIGFDAEAITDMILFDQIADFLDKDDVVIIFTTQATWKEYYDFCKKFQKNKVKTIVISCSQTSLLRYSEYSILLPSISSISSSLFLDDQAIIFVFIEILLAELAYTMQKG